MQDTAAEEKWHQLDTIVNLHAILVYTIPQSVYLTRCIFIEILRTDKKRDALPERFVSIQIQPFQTLLSHKFFVKLQTKINVINKYYSATL